MSESPEAVEVEAMAHRAQSLWREAIGRSDKAGVELFLKAAIRVRVTRDRCADHEISNRAFESGIAVRLFRAGLDRAGFASASGLSTEVVNWAVDTAGTFRAHAVAAAPDHSASVSFSPARWDLDAATPLPSREAMITFLQASQHLEWIEAGTTVEVLIGTEGWLAARRRHRLWGLARGAQGSLIAQRGFTGWERLLDLAGDGGMPAPTRADLDPKFVVLTPQATAPVVSNLVGVFHGPESPAISGLGVGWSVADDPSFAHGLVGGAFDDAGFPAIPRVLAVNGLWVDRLGGPGTFRRASFRDPPMESASNLVVPPGEPESFPPGALVARRCRVIRPTHELWVLGLETFDPGRGVGPQECWVRVGPQALIESCFSRLGGSEVTAEGPVVPALVLRGLSIR